MRDVTEMQIILWHHFLPLADDETLWNKKYCDMVAIFSVGKPWYRTICIYFGVEWKDNTWPTEGV